MPRIRSLKPEFFRDELLSELGLLPMLVFAGLWCVADKEGRFEWYPRLLKLDILPFHEFDMGEVLTDLWRAGRVSRYNADGKKYGFIVNFKRHQRISGTEAKNPARYPSPELGSIEEAPGKQEAIGKHVGSTEQDHGAVHQERVIRKGLLGSKERGESEPPPLDQPGSTKEALRKHVPRGTSDEVPSDLHPLSYAAKIIDEFAITNTPGNLRTIAASFSAQICSGKSPPAALEFLIAVTRDAIDEGIPVDKFFFEDQKWLKGNRNGNQQVNKAEERTSRNRATILAGLGAGKESGHSGPGDALRPAAGGSSPVVEATVRRESRDD